MKEEERKAIRVNWCWLASVKTQVLKMEDYTYTSKSRLHTSESHQTVEYMLGNVEVKKGMSSTRWTVKYCKLLKADIILSLLSE